MESIHPQKSATTENISANQIALRPLEDIGITPQQNSLSKSSHPSVLDQPSQHSEPLEDIELSETDDASEHQVESDGFCKCEYCSEQTGPEVTSLIVDRAAAALVMPSLATHLDNLAARCQVHGKPFEYCGILVEADDVGPNSYHSNGNVLIVNIPDHLVGLLNYFVEDNRCHHLNLIALDLTSTTATLVWPMGGFGNFHDFAIDYDIIEKLVCADEDDRTNVWTGRTIFCAGDKVAFSAFWLDRLDLFGWQTKPSVIKHSLSKYSEKEITAARTKVETAGSPTPWMHSTWKDDYGNYLTQVHCFTNDKL